MNVENAGMSGKMVCEVTGATFAYGDRPVIKDFSTIIMRGDRIGIIGPTAPARRPCCACCSGRSEPQAGGDQAGHPPWR